MRSIKSLILMLILTYAAASMVACKKDSGSPAPGIDYVRITDPAAADSLITGGRQGQLIAIVGQNLEDTREVWFNDQRALLTPTLVSKRSILVNIPARVPVVLTNKIKLVFSNGEILEYDFKVEINAPVVSSMLCEYVNAGSIATIQGNYFYEPASVTFNGGVQGEIVSVQDRVIQVRIPEDAQPGEITVKTNFGETKSSFWFRDNRNIFLSSDPFEGWWGAAYVVSDPGPGDPPLINGNYFRVVTNTGSPALAGGPPESMPNHSKNIPDGAILNPENYLLKFEINTMKPFNAKYIRMTIAQNVNNNTAYNWRPPLDTKGQWQTVIIPFKEIWDSYSHIPETPTEPNPNGYWTVLQIQGGGSLDADLSFDNFRVVPKTAE